MRWSARDTRSPSYSDEVHCRNEASTCEGPAVHYGLGDNYQPHPCKLAHVDLPVVPRQRSLKPAAVTVEEVILVVALLTLVLKCQGKLGAISMQLHGAANLAPERPWPASRKEGARKDDLKDCPHLSLAPTRRTPRAPTSPPHATESDAPSVAMRTANL